MENLELLMSVCFCVKHVNHQIWANFQVSEAKMAILNLFSGTIVSLECVSAIIALMFYVNSRYLRSKLQVWRNQADDLH